MSNLIIVTPLAPFALSASRGTGVENLRRRSPRAVWQDDETDGSPASINVDIGSDTPIDTVALIGTNAAATAEWNITSGTAAQGHGGATARLPDALLRAPTEVDVGYHPPASWPALHHIAVPFTARHLRITVAQAAGADPLYIGAIIFGLAFRPTWNMEWDAGRSVIDTGTRLRLPDGGLATGDGAAVPTFAWTFGDLGDAELGKLWGLVRHHRTTRPALVVENPDATAGLAERIHYGTFANIDRYQRRQASKSRWSLEFEDWL